MWSRMGKGVVERGFDIDHVIPMHSFCCCSASAMGCVA